MDFSKIFKRKNKKGDIGDAVFVLVFLFVFSLVLLVLWKSYIEIQSRFDEKFAADEDQTSREILAKGSSTLSLFNSIYLLLLGGVIVGLAGSAYFLDTHPMFFFAFLFALVIVIVIAGPLSNAYETFSDRDEFTNATATFGVVDFVGNRLPTFIMFVLVITAIVMYAKFRFVR